MSPFSTWVPLWRSVEAFMSGVRWISVRSRLRKAEQLLERRGERPPCGALVGAVQESSEAARCEERVALLDRDPELLDLLLVLRCGLVDLLERPLRLQDRLDRILAVEDRNIWSRTARWCSPNAISPDATASAALSSCARSENASSSELRIRRRWSASADSAR